MQTGINMNEEQRKLTERMVLTIGAVIVIGVMVFNFFIQIRRAGEEYYKNQMTAIANNHAGQIYTDLHTTGLCGEMAAFQLAGKESSQQDDIISAASAIFRHTDASRVIYRESGGLGIEWDGEELRELDLTKFSYYEKISKVSDVKYTYIEDDESGGGVILLIVPVGEGIDRSLLIFYPVETLYDRMRIVTEFETGCFAVLINTDGTILTNSNYESNFFADSNLWNNIDGEFKAGIEKAKQHLRNRLTGCFYAESKEGDEEKTLVYAPVQINEWAIVIGVNQDYVSKKEKSYWKKSSALMWQIIGASIFFLIIFSVVNAASKKRNAEQAKKLRENADTDLLTGLTNKLATENRIKEYMEHHPDDLAMMFLLDIDNFKKINDTLGHAFGDEVLRTFGRNIGSIFRVTDIIGRTGGDEFTIFLKFLKNDENTLKEAEKLIKFFEDFQAGEYVKYSATASIGAAVFPADGATFDALYKAADAALYKAKKRGKNQLAFYDDRDRNEKEE